MNYKTFAFTLLLYLNAHSLNAQPEQHFPNVSNADQRLDSVQIQTETTTLTHLILPDILIITNKTSQLLSSTSSIALLEIKPSENINTITFDENLNRIPGISLQIGAVNTQRLTIRGVGSRTPYSTNRIKAYYGPIPLTTIDGTSTLDMIEPWMIDKIEVIKGPSSALHGAGLGGVIVLNPTPPKGKNKYNFYSETGSYGMIKGGMNVNLNRGKNGLNLGLSSLHWDGYRQNSALDRSVFQSNYNYNGQKHQLSIIAMMANQNAGIPSSLNLNQFKNNPRLAAPNWLAVKGHENTMRILAGATSRVKINNSINNISTLYGTYSNDLEHRPFNELQDNLTLLGVKEQFEILTSRSKSILGIEQIYERYRADFYDSEGVQRGNLFRSELHNRFSTHFYALSSWILTNRLKATAGINWNITSYLLDDLFHREGDDFSGTRNFPLITSPRLGINYQPLKNDFIYINIGHGYSFPSAEETLLPKGAINPKLNPEMGWSIELGNRFLLGEHILAEVTYYRMRLHDLLVTKRINESVFYGVNAGKTDHQGIEIHFGADWSIQSQLLKRHQLDISYWKSTNKFESFIDDEQDWSGNHLPGIPTQTFSSQLRLDICKNWGFEISAQHNGYEWLDDANTIKTDAHYRIDMKTKYLIMIGKKMTLTMSASVQNLTNQKYASMVVVNAPATNGNLPRYYYPALPRTYFASLVLSYR